MLRILFRKVLPVIFVLGIGVLCSAGLMKSKKRPKPHPIKYQGTLTEVIEVAKSDETLVITGTGTVKAARSMKLQAEVSGRITKINPQLVPGGIIRKGGTIAVIDTRDYQAAVKQRKAQVEDVHFNLTLEKGNQAVAEKEWELFDNQNASESMRDLALRKPHFKRLQASLEAAKSALYQAEINLSRTRLIAPFDVMVQEEFLEVGQLVTPQAQLATLVGIETYWVETSIPVAHLRYMDLPDINGENGAIAEVIYDLGEGDILRYQGRFIRLLGRLEAAGHLARILIEIDDPLGLHNADFPIPLLIGAFVSVEIQGTKLLDVIKAPRKALHENNQIWIMDSENRLDIRQAKVIWRRPQEVLLKSGINAGERLVISKITTPLPGTLLRTYSENPPNNAD